MHRRSAVSVGRSLANSPGWQTVRLEHCRSVIPGLVGFDSYCTSKLHLLAELQMRSEDAVGLADSN